MTCHRKQLEALTKAEAEATRIANEVQCNMVLLSINNKWAYDKESCWVRDGKLGTLIKVIEYDKL